MNLWYEQDGILVASGEAFVKIRHTACNESSTIRENLMVRITTIIKACGIITVFVGTVLPVWADEYDDKH